MKRIEFLRKAAASIAAVALAPLIIEEVALSMPPIVWPDFANHPVTYKAFKYASSFRLSNELMQDMDEMKEEIDYFIQQHILQGGSKNNLKFTIGTYADEFHDDFAEDMVTVLLTSTKQ